jgi:hypothetical protein
MLKKWQLALIGTGISGSLALYLLALPLLHRLPRQRMASPVLTTRSKLVDGHTCTDGIWWHMRSAW